MPQQDQPDNISKARMLLATRRFLKLDEWLLLHMRSWQNQGESYSDYGLLMHPSTLFGGTESQTLNPLEILSDWAQQCPQSYHAHVLLGMVWHENAWMIRQAPNEEDIEDHQWLGAQLCCDYAVLAFLKAIELHPRPTHAFRHMMNLSGGFGEPYWLKSLFAGEIPKPLHEKFSIQGSEVWQAGIAHIHALGFEPATHWPQALPAALQQTRKTDEDALSYWLRMAMSVRHADVGTMESYLLFHSAFWGGSDEQQMLIIDSPLCAEFSDDERNQFRANALCDALSGEIADRESPRAAQLQQQLAGLLAQPLTPATRIRLLDLAGICMAYWQDDDQAGLAVYQDLFAVSPQAMPGHFAALFISRAVLANGHQEGLPVLTQLLTRALSQATDPVLVSFAAAALQYGLYGLPARPELSSGLMEHAWSLMQQSADEQPVKDLVTLAHDMAINDDLEAAHFLMTEMARHGSAIHCYELYFFYRNGWHQDVPEQFHNDSNAMDCVLSAARSGLVPAMFTCANALREGLGAEPDYEQAMHWYQRAADAGHLSAAYFRASCALDNGTEAEKRLATGQWLPEILHNVAHPDRAEAAYTLGMAWLTGTGTKKNRYTASKFIEFALELNPESEAARQVHQDLNGSLRARMNLWQDKRKAEVEDPISEFRQPQENPAENSLEPVPQSDNS
ncbi:DUF4034 domain-containing protein [Rahnella sikkimica]|uniref:DUF4034 domain-containing protein n=1 Tax=Rahnella sikkimica TaxID=1805933 RepID=A0A2L1ULD4_9GAMM|nr:DUF4034 domain-containing protein [Rahnella sikkimica]AVF33745.1 hypothetical protein BV494_01855 [Rahnella sikkimica]